ncbi:molybdenum cofactor synthesis domain protein [Thioalkalivibrio sp. K90mix]|uniref:molybdopterin molybdotransferase MoeA n=1 Tax=Thioalkalivibrio sp. (strain K90mix) TaxID=396595 RepID=UPI000195954A|nr:gephyrin-like molybdotransferase Glp [Thioalkalivibrio sp. K90mix]ADC72599.1 molybdenum cofactor synthesis domain protein [Thioalkalivibrio sp. K90mix]
MSVPSCDEFDPNALTLEQARAAILQACDALTESETVPLESALGRTLAEPVAARIDVPPAAVSAMDGYALRADDAVAGRELMLAGTSAAGHPWDGRVEPGQCVRILTGAVVPDGADVVIMQEQVERVGAAGIRLNNGGLAPGHNIRGPGSDTASGTALFDKGQVIGAAEIGVLASQGIAELRVLRKPRVAFFSTGDELVPLGEPLGPGQIHDSNRHTLRALLAAYPVEALDYGVIRDTEAAVREALERAGQEADLIITTGGVSVGDADHVTRVLQASGQVGFWKIAIKPGRPLAFGRFGNAHFLGLPGNPVAVMTTFALLVRPALQALSGRDTTPPQTISARLVEDLHKTPGRKDFQRAVLATDDRGWTVRSAGGQSSHQLRAMSEANAYIVLPRESDGARVGEWVEVLPFREIF